MNTPEIIRFDRLMWYSINVAQRKKISGLFRYSNPQIWESLAAFSILSKFKFESALKHSGFDIKLAQFSRTGLAPGYRFENVFARDQSNTGSRKLSCQLTEFFG